MPAVAAAICAVIRNGGPFVVLQRELNFEDRETFRAPGQTRTRRKTERVTEPRRISRISPLECVFAFYGLIQALQIGTKREVRSSFDDELRNQIFII